MDKVESIMFCIDFARNGKSVPVDQLEVLQYDPEDLAAEMREFRAARVEDLSDYDRVVFSTEVAAEGFLTRYKAMLATLTPGRYCHFEPYPAMAYTKRHLVMTLMGYKMQTYRDYNKHWSPGQLFNLHDRCHFVTVRLKQITKEDGKYRYDFELP